MAILLWWLGDSAAASRPIAGKPAPTGQVAQ